MKIVKGKDFTSIVADSEEFFEFNGVRTQRVDFPKGFKNYWYRTIYRYWLCSKSRR